MTPELATLAVQADLAGSWVTPQGYLVVPAVLARTGVIDFGSNGGRKHFGADVLLSPAALSLWSVQVLTDDHPTDKAGGNVAVTSANVRQYAVGFLRNARAVDVEVDGKLLPHLAADLVVTDQYAIDALRAGKRELSIGAWLTSAAATKKQASAFDWNVTEIGPNHVALVDKGACGASCKVVLHAPTAAPTAAPTIAAPTIAAPTQEETTMDCPHCKATAAVTTAAQAAELDALRLRTSSAEKAAEESRAKADTAAAQLAASQASEGARVEARIALLSKAREVVGATYAPAAGASDLVIMSDVVAARLPACAESVKAAATAGNAAYVEASYAAALATSPASASSATLQVAAAVGGAAPAAVKAPVAGYLDGLRNAEAARLARVSAQ